METAELPGLLGEQTVDVDGRSAAALGASLY